MRWAQIDPDSALRSFQFYKSLIKDGKLYSNSRRLCRPKVAVLRGACFNMKDRVRRPLTAMILHLSENLMSDLFVFGYISASFIVESISRHSAGRGSQRSPNPIQ